MRRADLPWLALVVFAGGGVGPVLLMLGLRTTAASTAALLLNLEGLATMAIAWLAFRENVDRRVLLGAFAILAGAALLSWQGGAAGGIGWGALAIGGACLAWGVDNNLTRKLSAADPLQIAMVKGVAAGAANLVLALVAGNAACPAPGWRSAPASSASSATASAWCCSCWRSATSARRARAPTSRRRRSSARRWRWSPSASR